MGTRRGAGAEAVTDTETWTPPGRDDLEITLFGPGYGESLVLHVGDGVWVLVDSCVGTDGNPVALRYLQRVGVDPATDVALVVATHWHDDHIRGMAQQVAACSNAEFCCAAALCQKEFLTTVGTLEGGSASTLGSGLREIHHVISHLASTESPPTHALANRRIFHRDACGIWALSPTDAVFGRFLVTIGALLPDPPRPRRRLPALSPNDVAVALWVQVADVAVLLGSDLERRGWTDILQSRARPSGTASVFKVPHHGAEDADEPGVWRQLLSAQPIATLTPWSRGAGTLPKPQDVNRILSRTTHAYITAQPASASQASRRRPSVVERTLRRAPVKLRRVALSPGGVRLRRRLATGASWRVETLNGACHLKNFAA